MFYDTIWPIIFYGVLAGLYVVVCHRWGPPIARTISKIAAFIAVLPLMPGVWLGGFFAGTFGSEPEGEHYDGDMR